MANGKWPTRNWPSGRLLIAFVGLAMLTLIIGIGYLYVSYTTGGLGSLLRDLGSALVYVITGLLWLGWQWAKQHRRQHRVNQGLQPEPPPLSHAANAERVLGVFGLLALTIILLLNDVQWVVVFGIIGLVQLAVIYFGFRRYPDLPSGFGRTIILCGIAIVAATIVKILTVLLS